MSKESAPIVKPILTEDLPAVAGFLHEHLNARLTADGWHRAILQPWPSPVPNHGFMLTEGERVLGVGLALYSMRSIDGIQRVFCNLAALCVVPAARTHTFRLIRAALKQPGLEFTDLSPSGNVVEINRRLGFQPLDTTTYLTANLWTPRKRGVQLYWRPDDLDRQISGEAREVFDSHRETGAAHHLLAVRGKEQCYVIFRRDRRKRLPLFASVLYVSNPHMYPAIAGLVGSHLLVNHRIPATLSEPRVTGTIPRHGWRLSQPRPKMFKSTTVTEARIDYLYSELMCVPW